MMKHKITSELFVISYEEKFILYSPLKRLGFLVNQELINFLNKIGNEQDINRFSGTEESILKIFQDLGIVDGEDENFQDEISSTFAPTDVTLFLTNRCNLRCIYCYASGGEKDNLTMSWPITKSAIDYIVNNAVNKDEKSIGLGFHGGGEPTLAWDILKKCVEYFHEIRIKENLDFNISIATNGIFSTQKAEWIINNFTGANISLDGIADIQNFQRPMADGSPTFDAVLNTMREMDNKDFNYGIRATITDRSSFGMAEFTEYLGNNTKVKDIHFEPTFICGRCQHTNINAPKPKDFIKGFRDALKVGEKFNIKIKYSGARITALTTRFCQAAGNSFCVTPDGYVTSCYEVCSKDDPRSKTFFFGRYDKYEKQFQINKEKLNKLKNRTVKNIKFCKNCFCKYNCAGDCLTRATNGFDLFKINNPLRCEINQEFTKDQIIKLLCSDYHTSVEIGKRES